MKKNTLKFVYLGTLLSLFLFGFSAEAALTDDFVITVDSTQSGTSASDEFEIPTNTAEYTYDYNVDCDNDGTDEATGQTGNYTCNFTSSSSGSGAGTYTIRIKDNTGTSGVAPWFPQIYFNDGGDKEKITSVEQWGYNRWQSFRNSFWGASNLVINATDTPDLSVTTSMASMFFGATSLGGGTGDWNWDVSNVPLMTSVFSGATSFNKDIGSWNPSSATNLAGMFTAASSFNQDLNSWDVSNVTDFGQMFNNASSFNGNISSWTVSSATEMDSMFRGATVFNQDLGSWNVSGVQNFLGMFRDSAFNQDISGWTTGSATNMAQMFMSTPFNQDISSWDVADVTDFDFMFYLNTDFNQDIGGWNMGSAVDLAFMFGGATAFDQDVGSWDVADVTNMGSMFNGVTLSVANYDALLTGWEAQTLQSGVTFDGGNSQYCNASAERASIISTYSWTISDGGSTTCDSTPPTTPASAPDLQAASDTGSSTTDDLTNDTTPTFDVVCSETGSTITLYVDGSSDTTAACSATGTRSITASALTAGTYSITYTETDAASNESSASPALSITLDTTASDGTIETPTNGSPVTGTAEANSSVTVSTPSGSSCSATADGSGDYSCTLSPTPVDSEDVRVQYTDIAGNTSSLVTESSGIDVTAPTAPTVDTVAVADTSITGTGENGTTITLSGYTCTNAPITVALGIWECEGVSPSPSAGTTITATSTDDAGNTSSGSYSIPSASVRTSGSSFYMVSHWDSSFKKQEEKETPPLCSLTQNLRQGARDGVFHAYAGGIAREVNLLQKTLNLVGFNAGIADGIFGNKTATALRQFQTQSGLLSDAHFGPRTRTQLLLACSNTDNNATPAETESETTDTQETESETCDAALTQNLRQGARDGVFHVYAGGIATQVARLQSTLNVMLAQQGRATQISTDGIFGAQTQTALQQLQTLLNETQNTNLDTDGILGPNTRSKINSSCSDF
jgi:surface protein